MQTLRAGCSKAEPKISPRRRPLPGYYLHLQSQFAEDRCTQFRVIVVTDPQTNKQTQPHTHRQDGLQYTAPLARSVIRHVIRWCQTNAFRCVVGSQTVRVSSGRTRRGCSDSIGLLQVQACRMQTYCAEYFSAKLQLKWKMMRMPSKILRSGRVRGIGRSHWQRQSTPGKNWSVSSIRIAIGIIDGIAVLYYRSKTGFLSGAILPNVDRSWWNMTGSLLLLHGIHIWVHCDPDRCMGGSRPNKNDSCNTGNVP